MKSVVPFSALYRPPRHPTEPLPEKAVLHDWTVETDPQFPLADPLAHFSSATGEYVIPIDGLYTLVVQLIPINGAPIASAARRRERVHYALRLTSPPCPASDQTDTVDATFLDVGSTNFGELVHLKCGTRIACLQMPGGTNTESVRMKIELIQRKRKRAKPQLTRKEVKKRRNQNRKRRSSTSVSDPSSPSTAPAITTVSHIIQSGPASAEEDDDGFDDDDDYDSWSDSDENDWESGFESDSTTEEVVNSKRSIRRLTKRFKAASTSSTTSSFAN